MSMTPETDAAVIDGYTFCQKDMRPAIAFCANLERERDAARAEIEAMREAIREAHDMVAEHIAALDWPALDAHELTAALAKLKSFLEP